MNKTINNYEIKNLLMKTLSLEKVLVYGNSSHFQIIAIGDIFKGKSELKKQQIIYAPLIELITNNSIHALSIKTYTPNEWKNYCMHDPFTNLKIP